MKSTHKYKTAVWVDLVSPTAEEVGEVSREYGLDPDLEEKLLSPSARHTVEFRKDHAYLILHFPAFKDSKDGDAAYETDFVVGKDYVITARYGSVKELENFDVEKLENAEPKDPRDQIFFGLLHSILTNYDEKLVEVDHWIREVEQKIFASQEKESILELSEASRHLIDFKKITAVYPDAFSKLKEEGTTMFGHEFGQSCAELEELLAKLDRKLDTLIEAAHELRETNYSLLSTKQNEWIKLFSIVSTVIAVLVGIALIWLGYMAIK